MKTNQLFTKVFISFLLLTVIGLFPITGSAKDQPWKFVVLSDTRSDPCAADGRSGVNIAALGRIAAAVAGEKPDVVLVPGDLVIGNAYKCSPADPFPAQLKKWREVMKPVYDAHIPVLPVRGNHEILSKDYFPLEPCRSPRPDVTALQTWLLAFGTDVPGNGPAGQNDITFAYPHKNALFIGLDELASYLSYDRAWLAATLKAVKRRHLFVYGHFPAFGVMHQDNLSCNSAARDDLWNTIGANNGRLYFCGHDHFYDRGGIPDAAGNNIQQVLVGNGGAPFYNYTGGYADRRMIHQKRVFAKPGYVVVTVNGAVVTGELKTMSGERFVVSDRFGYTLPK